MSKKCFIIAEAGVNHNGDKSLALQLIDIAAKAGADAVKFQSFKAENVVIASAPKAEYQLSSTAKEDSQLQMLKALELPNSYLNELADHARSLGLKFMSTAFDIHSLNYLVDKIKVDVLKVPSGEITNGPFLLEIARKGLPIICSTGTANESEIESALDILAFGLTNAKVPKSFDEIKGASKTSPGASALQEKVIVLHCVSEYPAPFNEVNLNAMDTMREKFNLPIGYSDHTTGIVVPIAAVAKGACVIEKHFTISRTMKGPDHAASIEPNELRALVESIRIVEQALGHNRKEPSPTEIKNIPIVRRSLVAAKDIREGDVITAEMLTAKRPGTGVSPLKYWELLGTKAKKSYSKDQQIT